MEDIKNKLKLYRVRECNIDNIRLDIEYLKLNGIKDDDERIRKLEIEVKIMESENRKINNILCILPIMEQRVVKSFFLEGKEKKVISNEVDRTERQINNIIKKALKKVARVID